MFYRSDELKSDILSYVGEVFESERWSNGKYTERFSVLGNQKLFEGRDSDVGVLPCVNGTIALEIALDSISKDGFVLVPNLTAPSVWQAASKFTTLYYSVENEWELDVEEIERVFKDFSVKAIVVVHTGGLVDRSVVEVRDLCHKYGVDLIEDISHAHGCRTYDGILAGGYGDYVVGSMYATKAITSGEGGFIATYPGHLVDKVYLFWNAGRNRKEQQILLNKGTNGRPSEFQVAIMYAVMKEFDHIVARRKFLAKEYDRLIDSRVSVPIRDRGIDSSYYKYIVLGDPKKVRVCKSKLKDIDGITGDVHSRYYKARMTGGEDCLSNKHLCLNLFLDPEKKREIADIVNKELG